MNAVSFSLHVHHHGVCVDVYVHIKGEALGFCFSFRIKTSGKYNHATRVAMSTLSWQTHGAMFVILLLNSPQNTYPALAYQMFQS